MKRMRYVILLVLIIILVVSHIGLAEQFPKYIVKYKSYVSSTEKAALLNQVENNRITMDGSQVIEVKESSYNSGLQYITVQSYDTAAYVEWLFGNSPNVEYLEPDHEFDLLGTGGDNSLPYTPPGDDPRTGDDNPGTPLLPVTVAILDSGVDATHPLLSSHVLSGFNVIDHTTDVTDLFGHGTHVAGKVIGNQNFINILPVKIIDDSGVGTYSDLIEGIYYAADQNVKVINMSLGCQYKSLALDEAIEYAKSKGKVLVAAAGNYACDAKIYPAAYEGVLSVGALNEYNERLHTSSYGEHIDIVAPGQLVSTTDLNGTYAEVSGTSISAAIVSNAVAQLAYNKPDKSAVWIRETLKSTATDLGNIGWDRNTGYGVLNTSATLSYTVTKDLALCGVDSSIENPLPNQITQLTFYIRNAGVYSTNSTSLLFTVNGVQQTKIIPSLEPGIMTKVTFDWCPPGTGQYNLVAEFTYSDEKTSNNKLTVVKDVTTEIVEKVEFQNMMAYYMDEDYNVQIEFDVVNKGNTSVSLPLYVQFGKDVIYDNGNEMFTINPGERVKKSFIHSFDLVNAENNLVSSLVVATTSLNDENIIAQVSFCINGNIEPFYSYGYHGQMLRYLIDAWAQVIELDGTQNGTSKINSYKESIIEGSKQEDLKWPGSLDHGWDPDKGASAGWLGYKDFNSAYEKAVLLHENAKKCYENQDYETAFWYVGRVLHLLQDMSVPSHAHGDIHLKGMNCYEEWTGKTFNSLENLKKYGLITDSANVPRQKVSLYPLVNTISDYKHSLMYKMAEFADNYDGIFSNEETVEGDVMTWKLKWWYIIPYPVRVWRDEAKGKPAIANATLPELSKNVFDALYWYKENFK